MHDVQKFTNIIHELRRTFGEPEPPPARGPFELVLWENSAYLLPDERRLEVFTALRDQVGLNAAAIDAAPDAIMLPIAMRGGMRPEMRVFRWRQIATITLTRFGGNLAYPGLALCKGQSRTETIPHHRRPGSRENTPVLRNRQWTSRGIKWVAGFSPPRMGAYPEELWSHLSFGTGRSETGTAGACRAP